MASTNLRCREIKGLLPSVEPTVVEDIYALTGRNYVFDTRGPRSAFGNRLLLPQKLGAPEYVQGLRIKLREGDRCFTYTGDSILEWDEVAGGWAVIYLTPGTSDSPYRWTWGYLNGKVFFCHPRTGILVYDVATRVCKPHDGPGTPDEALAICVNNGRLCAVTPVYLAWSSPSNGMDFTPALGGAGFHVISDTVSGYPIMVTSYTRGVLVWTTGGVMRSEFTGDEVVYRHRALQTEYRPANSFCTCKIDDDTVVILDERGLFQSKGEAPTPLTPLFNEFLAAYIQDNNLRVGQNLRIEWDELQRRLYVSTSLSESDPRFENCFVLYPGLDKWGQFNETHYGILPLLVKTSERADDYYGFVDSVGRVRMWSNLGWRELDPSESTEKQAGNLIYPPMQKPFSFIEGEDGVVLSSSGVVNTVNDILVTQPAGYYLWDGLAPMPAERIGLDAHVVFGLFRVMDNPTDSQMGEVVTLKIRNLDAQNSHVGTGFNLDPGEPTLDLSQSQQAESFTDESYVNHKLRVIGTIDGQTAFVEQEPSLTGFAKSTRYYSCSVPGLWHMLELRAEEVGESFHPVTIEMTAIPGGVLN